MTLLIMAKDMSFRQRVQEYIGKEFNVIQRDNPIDVVNEIDVIEPEIIVYRSDDFPRHWKPLLAMTQHGIDSKTQLFILQSDIDFSLVERSKAGQLGVHALLEYPLQDDHGLEKLSAILKKHVPKIRSSPSSSMSPPADGTGDTMPDHAPAAQCVIRHPHNLRLIPGSVRTLSNTGIVFVPEHREALEGIAVHQTINVCVLQIMNTRMTLCCKVLYISDTIELTFERLSEEEHACISEYCIRHGR